MKTIKLVTPVVPGKLHPEGIVNYLRSGIPSRERSLNVARNLMPDFPELAPAILGDKVDGVTVSFFEGAMAVEMPTAMFDNRMKEKRTKA